jgi:hypothetical protein
MPSIVRWRASREGTLGRDRDREVAVLPDVLDVLVDECLDELRVVPDALQAVDDALGGAAVRRT